MPRLAPLLSQRSYVSVRGKELIALMLHPTWRWTKARCIYEYLKFEPFSLRIAGLSIGVPPPGTRVNLIGLRLKRIQHPILADSLQAPRRLESRGSWMWEQPIYPRRPRTFNPEARFRQNRLNSHHQSLTNQPELGLDCRLPARHLSRPSPWIMR